MNTSSLYDEDYFENGVQTGKSGYQNYQWIPELTIKMAHHLIIELKIKDNVNVLDFGCAKGFLVKALRLLDVHAYGVDISKYAINQLDPNVRDFCSLISGADDNNLFDKDYEWMLSKDVFEHMSEQELKELLTKSTLHVNNIFAAVPLGKDDGTGFIIPEYDKDITHVTKKPLNWWTELFENTGWKVEKSTSIFRGVKDSWTNAWPEGNAFFILSRKK